MCDKHCPKCGSDAHLIAFLSIMISFESWELASLFALAVAACGLFLKLSYLAIFGFIFLALIPLWVSVQRKEFCDRCQIEFVPAPRRRSVSVQK